LSNFGNAKKRLSILPHEAKVLFCLPYLVQGKIYDFIYWRIRTSGDSRIKKVGGHCGAKEKSGGATKISILHGDFSLF